MNETTENFWAAFSVPREEPKPIFFRLYYDKRGDPLFYTMEDLPGKYIEIDKETYLKSSMFVKVVSGKIIENKTNTAKVQKLRISKNGTPCDPSDVTIIVSKTKEHVKWSFE